MIIKLVFNPTVITFKRKEKMKDNQLLYYFLGKPPIEIVQFLNYTFDLVECRGSVGKSNNISFFIHLNEQNHSIPHVHAQCGSLEISISLIDFTVLAGNLPKKQERYAIKWVKKHQEDLLTKWKDTTISRKLTCKMPRPYQAKE